MVVLTQVVVKDTGAEHREKTVHLPGATQPRQRSLKQEITNRNKRQEHSAVAEDCHSVLKYWPRPTLISDKNRRERQPLPTLIEMPLGEELKEIKNTDEDPPVHARPEGKEENDHCLDSDSKARPLTLPVEHTESEVRRSTRERRPQQFLTNSLLG